MTQQAQVDREDEAKRLHDQGCHLNNMGQHLKALECFNEALELAPDVGMLWGHKAYALLDLDREEEAIECFSRATQLKPEGELWRGQALAILRLTITKEQPDYGLLEVALKATNEAIMLDERDSVAWALRAGVLELLCRYEGAVEACEESQSIEPKGGFAVYAADVQSRCEKKLSGNTLH